jgi:hypothetical protein
MALAPKYAGTGINLIRVTSVIESFDQAIAIDPCDSNMNGVLKRFHHSVSSYLTQAEMKYIVDQYKAKGWTYANMDMSEDKGSFPATSVATLELQYHGR